MNQIIIKKGKAVVEQVPSPTVSDNTVIVKVFYSCISAGTELAGVKLSSESTIQKAMKQPKKVNKVIKMLGTEGFTSTIYKIKNKLQSGCPTGYSAAGIVIEVGKNINDLKAGDRVACAGAGIANHADFIEVPRNLIVKVPRNLSFELASTTTMGAIAMQGVRRADVRIGENVVVIGLGILGQITVQILKASGCNVVGIDTDSRRIEVAKKAGMLMGLNPKENDCVNEVFNLTNGFGADSVIITASTESAEPLSQAFKMCRKKGRVVLVGTVGMEINREDMYEKELDFYISSSYGPGRYDESYEKKGVDYPYGYVRWTENRNMQAYLELLSSKSINIDNIIEEVFDSNEAERAFEVFNSETKPLIVLLKYNKNTLQELEKKEYIYKDYKIKGNRINVAVVGAGGFARAIHLPNLRKLKDKFNIYAVVSRTGYNAKLIAKQFGARYATTDYNEILEDKNVDLIMICTRHNLHASMAVKALKAGKAVFVEKPMAINEQELDELVKVINETKKPFLVGFNRRFSKYAIEAKRHIEKRINPMIVNYQMNAGYVPLDSWVHGEEGGGRIIGEACHIFDLFNFLADSEVCEVSVNNISPKTENVSQMDNVVITLNYKDGSVCNLIYTSLGNSSYPKERCQIFFDGKVIVIDDYKKIMGYGVGVKNIKTNIQDKGHYEELVEVADCLKDSQEMPIGLQQMIQATELSFLVTDLMKG